MFTTFIQNTGASYKQYNVSKLFPSTGGPFTHLTVFPVKSYNVSGLFTANSEVTYLGVETGKYPFGLISVDPFDGQVKPKELFFDDPILLNSNSTGIFANIGGGDGMYLIVD